jgi:hypothetical protein
VGSDLEFDYYAATADILEMMETGSSDDVQVIIETSGSAGSVKDRQRQIDFTTVRRYKVLEGDLELLEQVGRKNMSGIPSFIPFHEGKGISNVHLLPLFS